MAESYQWANQPRNTVIWTDEAGAVRYVPVTEPPAAMNSDWLRISEGVADGSITIADPPPWPPPLPESPP